MAARGRECAPGKEKRGTPSNQLHASTQRGHRLSLARQIDPDGKHNPPSSRKHLPSYLNHTVTSNPDVSKQLVKKQVLSDGAKKRNLTRTISLDKAPSSPSRTPKASTSSNPTLRSSLLSAKTATAQISIPNELVKTPKVGVKHHSLYARSVSTINKISITSKKREIGIGASATKEQVTAPPERVVILGISEVPQLKTLEEQEFSITGAEEIIHAGGYNETREVSMLEYSELVYIRQLQLDNHKDEELVTIENSTVSEHQHASTEVNMEEPGYVSPTKGIDSNKQDSDKQNGDEDNETKANGSVTSSPKVEAEGKRVKANLSDKKEEVVNGGEIFYSEGTKEQIADEVKQKVGNTAPPQQNTQRIDSVVSNDVIQETASRLREQRRNKVKALAGAFETVISLQEPK